MFNRAIMELYKLQESNIDNINITESVNLILKELATGMAIMIDIIADIDNKRKAPDILSKDNLN